MVHTTRNACPWVLFLIGQVTITAEQNSPVSDLSILFIHAAYLCIECSKCWAIKTGQVDSRRWATSILMIFPGLVSGLNATGKGSCYQLLHLPCPHLHEKLQPRGKGRIPHNCELKCSPSRPQKSLPCPKHDARNTKGQEKTQFMRWVCLASKARVSKVYLLLGLCVCLFFSAFWCPRYCLNKGQQKSSLIPEQTEEHRTVGATHGCRPRDESSCLEGEGGMGGHLSK